jgi:hypothetical protein
VDILLQAAKSWGEISKSQYIITYGLKKKLHDVKIVFENYDFYHLAGFQYLEDLQLPAVSRKKMVDAVLAGRIDGKYIKQSQNYSSKVESRLTALMKLEHSLDNDFRLFKYNPQFYPFYTEIKADYLIEGKTDSGLSFFFTVRSGEHYSGASIFMKKDRDFSANQKPLPLMKIEKVNIATNEAIVLLDRLTTQKPQK